MDILILTIVFGIVFVLFKIFLLKEPIFGFDPNKKKNESSKNKFKAKNQKANKANVDFDQADIIRELFNEVEDISHHMMKRSDNTFVLFAEVKPCNYFLLSRNEQKMIDANFETWLATLEHNCTWYLQNRYVDLSQPIEKMRENLRTMDDLPEQAREYGETVIEDMIHWQNAQPRYDLKRYILFKYTINPNKIEAETEEEFKEKLYDKAFAELSRRFNSSKQSLKRCKMELSMLTSEGIIEVLYHALNRKKSMKNKFRDVMKHEMLAEYLTADKSIKDIELVKELINDELTSENISKKQVG